MQLACPACHTAFHVSPAALGDEGRSVRCARCRNTWFARQEDLVPAPALADAYEDQPPAVEEEKPHAEPSGPSLIQPGVQWNDMVMVDVPSSPPLAPAGPDATAVPPVLPTAGAARGDTVSTWRRKRPADGKQQTRFGLVALLLGCIVVIGFTAREPLVRIFPGLAGFYSLIGLPVNLRGLEFHDLRTSFETQDGVPVLVIEGELVNPTRYTRDISRLRFAVLGADGREVYNWTALLPRETLLARESITFRTRLASPPEDGKSVNVRFLHRSDLTASR